MRIDELIEDFPEFEGEVYFGGPVQTDTIHYVHNLGDKLDDSQYVCDGIYWGGDFEQLKFLVETKQVDNSNIRFFVGYSGWGAGQLNNELNHGSWIVGSAQESYVLHDEPEELWSRVLADKGNLYGVIGTIPDAVSWN